MTECPEAHNKNREAPVASEFLRRDCDYLLIKAGIDLALTNTETHSREDWNRNYDGSLTEVKIADLLNDDETPQHYKTAFKQQTMIEWEFLFMGKMARGRRQCWTDKPFWG